MSMHLAREIDSLKNHVLEVGTLVEENTSAAVRALENRDEQLAQDTIQADWQIDEMEVTVEEECLKILALHQPVAADLRFIVAVLKINNDLERIGDLGVNIAERTLSLVHEEAISLPLDFRKMTEQAQTMLREGLDALVNMDMEKARAIPREDDKVDAINKEMYEVVKKGINENPHHLDQLIHLLSISRHIERIADLTTNIAEDVLYMGSGEITRHQHSVT
mgnify:CR=1 FL=1